MEHILIVDNDTTRIAKVMKAMYLNGMASENAVSKEEMLEYLNTDSFSLLVVGKTENGSALELIQAARNAGFRLPAAFIGAENTEKELKAAVDAGADLYLSGTDSPNAMAFKAKALVRRTVMVHGDRSVTAGPFAYDTSTLRLTKNGVEIPLSSKENALMKVFLDNVDRVFSKQELYTLVWGGKAVDENAIMVYINRIRRKIEDDDEGPGYIRNVRGIGYRFTVSGSNAK